MKEKLKKIIEERMGFLSKEAQEAINSLDWISIAEKIGKKYLLTEVEIDNFQVETLLILIGRENGEVYTRNIENEVGVSKEEAEKIADEAEEKIFAPIYNVLEENIKKSGRHKNANSEQTIDFILSGGDYSAFMEQNSLLPDLTSPSAPLSIPKWRGDGGEVDKGNTNIPIKPKMDDIRSKFTI